MTIKDGLSAVQRRFLLPEVELPWGLALAQVTALACVQEGVWRLVC
ncbi:MAG: hypothetical protein RIC14_09160 [Filomicrobium sp.]